MLLFPRALNVSVSYYKQVLPSLFQLSVGQLGTQ